MKNLKKLRTEHHLSQQQLADLVHVTQQSIWKYENNIAHPDIDTIKELAVLFHTSIDYLVGYSDAVPTLPGASITPVEYSLLQAFRTLEPDSKEALLQFLRSLSKQRACIK